MYKKCRSMLLTDNQQVLVYAMCKNYNTQHQYIKDKIDKLCAIIGKEDATALKSLLTGEENMSVVALKYHIGRLNKLCEMRKLFYESWWKTPD